MWEENGNVVAMLSLEIPQIMIKLELLKYGEFILHQIFKGKGIGHNLIAFAEQAAKEEGYTEVVIWAFKNNLNAISFYRKHGYILEKEEYLGKPYLTMGVRLNKKI